MTQSGQEIGVLIINDCAPDTMLILFEKVVEHLNQENFYHAMYLCYTEDINLKASLGDNYVDAACSVYTILANIFFEMGRYDNAFNVLKLLLQKNYMHENESIIIANTLNNLALCDIIRGKYKNAEKLFKKVLSKADEKEGDINNKSKLQQMLSLTKVFGMNNDSDKSASNIWQIAEERESNKGTRYEAAPPVWYKSSNLNSPNFTVALNGLAFLYEMRGKNVAAQTLRHFTNQRCTNTAETATSFGYRIITRSELPPPPPPLPPLSTSGIVPGQESSRRSAPINSVSPTPAPRRSLVQAYCFEKMIEYLEAELTEAQRTIETHGAFCSICKTEVANRIWSRCNHLAACNGCAENYNDSVTDEHRSRDGIPCPLCRTHGYAFPVYISS